MNIIRKFRKPLLALALIGLLIGTVYAATVTTKTITATYVKEARIVVNGIEITPKDANGKVVNPFAADGTTYLPLRAIGEALDMDVEWDGSTYTVYVGDRPDKEVNWMTKLPPYNISSESKTYDSSDPKNYFTVAGKNHTAGLTLQDHYSHTAYAIWNTDYKYSTMTFTVGNVSGNVNPTLEVYLDGEFSQSIDLKWDLAPKTYTIDLAHSPSVKLQFTSYDRTTYGIYDISFQE